MASTKKSAYKTEISEGFTKKFDKFSSIIDQVTGSRFAFIAALGVIVIWGITGPFFHYSERWLLIINVIESIITFLMVFVIQQSQNKDTIALQLKLNELIAANKFASNRLVGAEEMSPEELKTLKEFYNSLAKLTEEEKNKFLSHSLDKKETIEAVKEKEEQEKKEKTKIEDRKPSGKK